MDTDEPPLCHVRANERLFFVKGGGFLHSNGTFFSSGTSCIMEQGSGFAVLMGDRESRQAHGGGVMEPKPEVVEVSVPVVDPAVPAAEHHTAPAPVSPVALQSGESADLGQVLGIGEMLGDNPWTPLVLIILALVAVLGGRQGWKFYSERAAQRHELELKKLELQAQVSGLHGSQPPPCQARDVEQDQKIGKLSERMEEFDKRLAALERRLATFASPDNDTMEDIEKRLKKAERAIAAIKREDN